MEEAVLIFAIPAFFILVCLLFISANHLYYKIKSGHQQERQTSKISVINISNVASSAPPSPKLGKKHRRRRSQSPNSKSAKNTNKIPFPDHAYLSPVMHLDHNDCPPSYQSLYAFETSPHFDTNFGKDSNIWLHPNSAAGMTLPCYDAVDGTKGKGNSNNSAAVLHL